MRVAIIGSRVFNNYEMLQDCLDKILPLLHTWKIISGGAKGTDSLAERYAKDKDIPIQIIKPDWKRYGKSAGFIRNKQIIEKSDIVVAFWDGKSKGTESSIQIACQLKRETHIYYF